MGYVDQINLNGTSADIMGCGSDHYYPGVDLTTQFATEIASYTDAWAWIVARINAGNFSKLHVGDYIPVTCTNNHTFNARIAGINTYKGYGGSSVVGNHIDFISATAWPTVFKMNLKGFNNGLDADHPYPWLSSNGYHFLNSLSGSVPNGTGNLPATESVNYTTGGVYYYLPSALTAVIAEKRLYLPKRLSTSGIQSEDTDGGWINAGKLWLPSETEITGAQGWGSRQFGGAGFIQYPLFAQNMLRAIANATVWTLSAASGNTSGFAVANSSGIMEQQSAINDLRGLICFRVAATA